MIGSSSSTAGTDAPKSTDDNAGHCDINSVLSDTASRLRHLREDALPADGAVRVGLFWLLSLACHCTLHTDYH